MLFIHHYSTATSIQRHRNERRPVMGNYPVMNAPCIVGTQRLKQAHHSRQELGWKSLRWWLNCAYCESLAHEDQIFLEQNYRWDRTMERTKYCFVNVLPSYFLSLMLVFILRSFLQLHTELHKPTIHFPDNMHLTRDRIGVTPLLLVLWQQVIIFFHAIECLQLRFIFLFLRSFGEIATLLARLPSGRQIVPKSWL